MKKTNILVMVIVVVVCFTSTIVAHAQQGKKMEVRVGYLDPKDAKSGFSIGGSFGAIIDEAIEIGVGVDYFRRNYSKDTKVADQGYKSGVNE